MGGLQATSSSSMSCSCFFLKTIFVAIMHNYAHKTI